MLAYCGRPAAAAQVFEDMGDPFPYIVPRRRRETIAEIRSLGVALATASMNQTGSEPDNSLRPRRRAAKQQHNKLSKIKIFFIIKEFDAA
jgi:hypothetical protein